MQGARPCQAQILVGDLIIVYMKTTKEFWKEVRARLREEYGITPNTPLKEKKGYHLHAFLVGMAVEFNELGVPQKKTVTCEQCGLKFHPNNHDGLEKHIRIKHKEVSP